LLFLDSHPYSWLHNSVFHSLTGTDGQIELCNCIKIQTLSFPLEDRSSDRSINKKCSLYPGIFIVFMSLKIMSM